MLAALCDVWFSEENGMLTGSADTCLSFSLVIFSYEYVLNLCVNYQCLNAILIASFFLTKMDFV